MGGVSPRFLVSITLSPEYVYDSSSREVVKRESGDGREGLPNGFYANYVQSREGLPGDDRVGIVVETADFLSGDQRKIELTRNEISIIKFFRRGGDVYGPGDF